MKQVIAVGKWSKEDKAWKMVIALHRSPNRSAGGRVNRAEPRRSTPRPTDIDR